MAGKLNLHFRTSLRNFVGACVDGAVLFPLLVTLAVSTNGSLAILLGSSGVIYLFSAFFVSRVLVCGVLTELVLRLFPLRKSLAAIEQENL